MVKQVEGEAGDDGDLAPVLRGAALAAWAYEAANVAGESSG